MVYRCRRISLATTSIFPPSGERSSRPQVGLRACRILPVLRCDSVRRHTIPIRATSPSCQRAFWLGGPRHDIAKVITMDEARRIASNMSLAVSEREETSAAEGDPLSRDPARCADARHGLLPFAAAPFAHGMGSVSV